MYTQYSLPVIHPAFELLKRSARFLHFIAAAAIFLNAWLSWPMSDGSIVLSITQMIIAADIFLLLLFTRDLLTDAPRMNVIFRFIESLVLFGLGISLAVDGHGWFALLHFVASVGYFLLMHREVRVIRAETVNIKPTGITLPSLLVDMELGWNEIRSIVPRYHGISIETFKKQKIELPFRRNLKIDELEQIDDFCRQHLKISS